MFLLNKNDVVSKQAIAIKHMIHTINPAVMHTRCDEGGKLTFLNVSPARNLFSRCENSVSSIKMIEDVAVVIQS